MGSRLEIVSYWRALPAFNHGRSMRFSAPAPWNRFSFSYFIFFFFFLFLFAARHRGPTGQYFSMRFDRDRASLIPQRQATSTLNFFFRNLAIERTSRPLENGRRGIFKLDGFAGKRCSLPALVDEDVLLAIDDLQKARRRVKRPMVAVSLQPRRRETLPARSRPDPCGIARRKTARDPFCEGSRRCLWPSISLHIRIR